MSLRQPCLNNTTAAAPPELFTDVQEPTLICVYYSSTTTITTVGHRRPDGPGFDQWGRGAPPSEPPHGLPRGLGPRVFLSMKLLVNVHTRLHFHTTLLVSVYSVTALVPVNRFLLLDTQIFYSMTCPVFKTGLYHLLHPSSYSASSIYIFSFLFY